MADPDPVPGSAQERKGVCDAHEGYQCEESGHGSSRIVREIPGDQSNADGRVRTGGKNRTGPDNGEKAGAGTLPSGGAPPNYRGRVCGRPLQRANLGIMRTRSGSAG